MTVTEPNAHAVLTPPPIATAAFFDAEPATIGTPARASALMSFPALPSFRFSRRMSFRLRAKKHFGGLEPAVARNASEGGSFICLTR